MTDYRYLTVERRDAVLWCTLANPPRHTLVADAVAELTRFAASVPDDVRVVVFTGGGEGVFIAHYEVGELAAGAEREQGRFEECTPDSLHAFHRLLLTFERAPYVTVAAINGNAAGGGCEFALGCDFRLMADGDYRLGLPETGVGIIPGAGGTQRFARLLGTAKALELILSGALVTPREAETLGLVTRTVPADGFREAAAELAENLASRAPVALAAAKRAIYEGRDLPLEQALAVEQREFARCMASEDAAVAMRSWLEGKPWTWRGR